MDGSWGKTWRKEKSCFLSVHRVEHHCLDLLATGRALLLRDPSLLRLLSRALQMDPAAANRLFDWCLLIHDAGKIAGSFQAKSRKGWEAMRPGRQRPANPVCPHDAAGHAMLYWLVEDGEIFPDMAGHPDFEAVIAAAFFHHGRPRGGLEPYKLHFNRREQEAFKIHIEQAAAFVGPLSWPASEGARRGSWLLTGLVSLVDGLGSAVSDKIMEHGTTIPAAWVKEGMLAQVPWADYLAAATPVAQSVVESIGAAAFLPVPPPPALPAHAVLAGMVGVKDPARFVASPLQQAAADVELPGPFLAFIEDIMGSGKTEASALLVRRTLELGIASGGYWGLPTMATANGMYGRMRGILPLLYGGDAALVLAHGGRDELPLFRKSLRDVLGNPVSESADATETGGPTCIDWLVEGSHRSLLAHVGVGTVDQVLAAGLNSYHCGIRWVGLAGKVVVFDEVHAADEGMIEILARVLRHLGQLGISSILMSATLPTATRAMLLASYSDGAGWPCRTVTIDRTSYPILSVAGADRLEQIPLATRRDRAGLSHRFARIGSADMATRAILGWSKQERCAIWFRNTVKDAIDAYQGLKACLQAAPDGGQVILFHSRYTRARRTAIEAEVMRTFGPESTPELRRGKILVSTQVAEQSLDLDADEQVLDAAPADLILQRLGRRRRHQRDACGRPLEEGNRHGDQRPPSDVLLLAPDPSDVHDDKWLVSLLPRAAAVYRDTGRVWKSVQLLLDPSLIPGRLAGLPPDCVVPDMDARPLVEAVYPPVDGDLRSGLPQPLKLLSDRAAGTDIEERADARRRAFAFRGSYLSEASEIRADFEDTATMTSTRTGDGDTVYLAVDRGRGWTWLEPGGMRQSAVPVRNKLRPDADGLHVSQQIRETLDRASAGDRMSDEAAAQVRREIRLLEGPRPPVVVALRPWSGGSLRGSAEKVGGGAVLFSYDDELGLQDVPLG